MGWVTKLGPGRCQFLLPERSRFSQIGHIIFRALVALKMSVPFTCRFAACSSRIKVRQTDTQTDRPSTVTLTAHARRGLMNVWTGLACSLYPEILTKCVLYNETPLYTVDLKIQFSPGSTPVVSTFNINVNECMDWLSLFTIPRNSY